MIFHIDQTAKYVGGKKSRKKQKLINQLKKKKTHKKINSNKTNKAK